MAVEVFAESIAITGTPGGTLTLAADAAGVSASLTEVSGTIDGSSSIGETVTYDFPGFSGFDQPVTLVALTPEGPIVQFSNGDLNLLTNNSGLTNGSTLLSSTSLTYNYCFAAGTGIKTPDAERAVENLEIGDIILTETGTPVAVKWIGTQTLHRGFSGLQTQMVRIRAGALGNDLPHSDLTVTADHGMVLSPSSSEAVGDNNGYVINASALVNGSTIDWIPTAELEQTFTVYHIETEAHDVILANGAPAETFIDVAGRAAFDNYQEYLDLYGVERIIPEMRTYRITTQRLLPEAIKTRLGMQETQISIDRPLSA